MSLQERLPQEIKAAMLAKDADRLSTLRLLKSAIGYILIEAQKRGAIRCRFCFGRSERG